MTRYRVFFYVQHLLGIGHLHRAAAIARALQAEGLDVFFVSGGVPVTGLDLGGAELVQLPPALTADAAFSGLVDAEGRPVDDAWKAGRRAALLEAFARIEPQLLLIELFPFGRRQFRFELLPLLEAAGQRQPRPACVSSVRDILVAKKDPTRLAETVAVARRYFDRILVHGDPRLVRFEETFRAAAEIDDLLCYTGYVVNERPSTSGGDAGRDEVLVSAGGGAVGETLLRTALAARPLSRLAAAPWRLITGTNMPAQAVVELTAALPPGDAGGVVIERFRHDFQGLLRNCRLSISQGGYNTVMELLCAGAPAVIVPFAGGQETEQALRARLLADRGLCTVVDEARLTPESLAAAVDTALERAPARPGDINLGDIDLGGAAGTARLVAALAARAGAG
jgi:predicted glycosyltransferase